MPYAEPLAWGAMLAVQTWAVIGGLLTQRNIRCHSDPDVTKTYL